MISIIVLTYNQEAFIRRTLDSILAQQTLEPIEIIIGDDHSSDGTSAICEAYMAQYPDRIRYIYNTPNLGLVQNFVTILRHCKGEYIALCDGDDYWTDEHKLQKQVQVMCTDANCVLVHTNRQLLADKIYTQPPSDKVVSENPWELFFHPYICVPTAMFRTIPVLQWLDTYEVLAKKQDWRMQDFPLWLYLGTQGTFRYLPENTAMYRVLPNTLSREQDKKKKYRFDCSVLRIKRYFYSAYYAKAVDKVGFRHRYREMEFHTRKRMLLDYGWIARKQVWALLRLLPYYPIIIYRHISRKII